MALKPKANVTKSPTKRLASSEILVFKKDISLAHFPNISDGRLLKLLETLCISSLPHPRAWSYNFRRTLIRLLGPVHTVKCNFINMHHSSYYQLVDPDRDTNGVRGTLKCWFSEQYCTTEMRCYVVMLNWDPLFMQIQTVLLRGRRI